MNEKSKYQDKYRLWHDRECINGEPRSNNWMIYTAYAKALGLEVSDQAIPYFRACIKSLTRDNITVHRHPNKPTPPLSFDECMGAVYLDLMPYDVLKGNHFVYIGHGQRLDSRIFERLIMAMIELLTPRIVMRGFKITVSKPNLNDRNRWWQAKLENVKYFAARLTPAHTYIVKRYHKKKHHTEEDKLWAFYRDNITKTKANTHGKRSTRNLLWLCHIMNNDHKRAKKLKPWISFEGYFGADHPFTVAMKRRYGIK